MIAHRLSTLQQVDRILVLDHGKLVQEGSHAHLISQAGVYRTLYDAQFMV